MTDPRQPARDFFWDQHDAGSYRCPGCGRGRESAGSFHVHHLDGDKQNNDPNNLVGLCPRCHLGEEHQLDVDGELGPDQPYGTGPEQPSGLTPGP